MHSDAAVERFYTTRAWRHCRESYLKSVGGLCEICYKKGLIVPAVHVHHIEHLTGENVNDPRISLNAENLMALCEECHTEQHRSMRWRCDAFGRVII